MVNLRDLAILLVPLTLVLACRDVPASEDEAGVTTSPGSVGSDGLDEATPNDEATPTDDAATGTSATSTDTIGDESTSAHFVPLNDMLLEQCMCDTYWQDCPQGEKCVPYSQEGDTWDCVKCVPVLGDQAVGEVCSSDGIVLSTDDCDASSWCFTLEGQGICHAFCSGSVDDPDCPSGSQCLAYNSGGLDICAPNCDPLLQNCDEGHACYWFNSNFSCTFVVQDSPAGEPCDFVNECALGLQCTEAEALPECAGAACCSPFCDVTVPEPQCEAFAGTTCVPFFPEGEAPPGSEPIGLCLVP